MDNLKGDNDMKKLYNHPKVQVSQIASMFLMQTASPAPGVYDALTDDQW